MAKNGGGWGSVMRSKQDKTAVVDELTHRDVIVKACIMDSFASTPFYG